MLPGSPIAWCEYMMKLKDAEGRSDDFLAMDALTTFLYQGPLREKNLSIPAAAGFFSLDASSGLLATASASAPAMFLALRSLLLWCELYDMRD